MQVEVKENNETSGTGRKVPSFLLVHRCLTYPQYRKFYAGKASRVWNPEDIIGDFCDDVTVARHRQKQIQLLELLASVGSGSFHLCAPRLRAENEQNRLVVAGTGAEL